LVCVTLLASAFAACHRTTPQTKISVAEETLGEARDAGFDCSRVLAQAEQGDRQSIAELLRFSEHVDTASALGHGLVLIQLLNIVADRTFAEAARGESAAVRRRVADLLDAGIDYVGVPQLQRPLALQAPLTAELFAMVKSSP